jgi:CHAT domain-containing protein
MRTLLFCAAFFMAATSGAQSILDTLQLSHTPADTAVAKEQLSKADDLLRLRKYKEAKEHAAAAKQIAATAIGSDNVYVVRAMVAEARALTGLRAFDEAMSMLQNAETLCSSLPGDRRTDMAYIALNMGLIWDARQEPAKAIDLKLKALDWYLQALPRNDRRIVVCANSLGNSYESYGNADKALEYKTMALEIVELTSGPNSLDAAILHNNLGVAHWGAGNLDQALFHHSKALTIRQKELPAGEYPIGESYNNLGLVYESQGQLSKARDAYSAAMLIFEGKEDQPGFGRLAQNVYNNLGFVYQTMGLTAQAVSVKQRSLDLAERLYKQSLETAQAWTNLGSAYRDAEDFDAALKCFQKSLDIRAALGQAKHAHNTFTLVNKGAVQIEFGRIDSALANFHLALDLGMLNRPDDPAEWALCYSYLGQGYAAAKNWQASAEYYHQCRAIRQNKYASSHPSIIIALLGIAQAHRGMEQADSAQYYFQLAFDLQHSSGETGYSGDPHNWLSAIAGLATLNSEWYLKTQIPVHLHVVNELAEQCISFLERQRIHNPYRQDHFRLSAAALPVFEAAVYANHFSFERSSGADDAARCFRYSEVIKGQQLYEAFKAARAEAFSNISPTLLEAEDTLAVQLAYFENQLSEKNMAGAPGNDSVMLFLHKRVVELREAYLRHRTLLRKLNPDYYRMKYDLATLHLDSLQRLLPAGNDVALLEYFVGERSILAFVIQHDSVKIKELPSSGPLEKEVADLRTGLFGAFVKNPPDSLYNHTCQLFARSASALYERLLAPIKEFLPQRLIIVPDGLLGYIPFEALLASPVTGKPYRFQEHSYLGKEKVISYAYSATLWQEMKTKQHLQNPAKTMLAMAPFFRGDRKALEKILDKEPTDADIAATTKTKSEMLDTLAFSGEEALRIARRYKGLALLDGMATRAAFDTMAASYRRIHLSTHGYARDDSWLAFYKPGRPLDADKLYLRDIYNLRLNADLVVLSACQTGIGKLRRGEGIISLSRAFAYAGAKGIIATLWSVNDEKTKDFMLSFYRHLEKKSAAEAMWEARREFLSTHKGEAAHPFYWAAFIGVGAM